MEGVVHHQRVHRCWCSVLTPYSTNTLIYCVVAGPSKLYFHVSDDIIIAMDSYRVSTVDVPESLIAAAQEVRDSSSSVTPCLLWRMMRFWTTKCFTQVLKSFFWTMESCQFNFDPGTLFYFCKHGLIHIKVNVLHTAVDWQSTVADDCTNSSNHSIRTYTVGQLGVFRGLNSQCTGHKIMGTSSTPLQAGLHSNSAVTISYVLL